MSRGTAKYGSLAGLSVLSLVLCAAAMVFWIRSIWVCDAWRPPLRQGLVCYQSYRGAVHYVRVTEAKLTHSMRKYPPPGRSSVPVKRAMLWQEWNGPPWESYSLLGFAYTSSIRGYTIAAIPYWALAALFAILPISTAPRIIRWLGKVPVHCSKCGMPIQGLTMHCPRCGNEIVHQVAPPPPQITKPPPRPTKKIESVVVKTATPDHSHFHPTDDSGRSA